MVNSNKFPIPLQLVFVASLLIELEILVLKKLEDFSFYNISC